MTVMTARMMAPAGQKSDFSCARWSSSTMSPSDGDGEGRHRGADSPRRRVPLRLAPLLRVTPPAEHRADGDTGHRDDTEDDGRHQGLPDRCEGQVVQVHFCVREAARDLGPAADIERGVPGGQSDAGPPSVSRRRGGDSRSAPITG
jgi:hypothetical protein